MFTVRFIFVLATVCFAFGSVLAQSDEKADLAKLNEDVVKAFKAGKVKDALELAQQALDSTLKVYGGSDPRTANAYASLGIIQGQRNKFEQAESNLGKAVEIYEKLGNQDLLEATLSLASIYAVDKKFEKADEYYLKSSVLAAKNYGVESERFQQVEAFRVCSGWSSTMLPSRDKAFYEKRKELLGDLVKRELGIQNGKAKYLPKPMYPSEARSQRLGGVIPVKVRIDEKGTVIEVKAICGHPSLIEATTDAVKNARFEPYLVDGQPSVVNALIVYSYIP